MNLQTFFNEKNLDDRIYEVESKNGTLNLISTADVIQRILSSAGEERENIKRILLELDIQNGDLHHFLKHLAQALAIDF